MRFKYKICSISLNNSSIVFTLFLKKFKHFINLKYWKTLLDYTNNTVWLFTKIKFKSSIDFNVISFLSRYNLKNIL